MFIPKTPTIDWDVLICIPYIFVWLKIYLQTDCKSQKASLNWLTIGRIAWMSNYLWRENSFLPKVEKWPLAQDPKQQPFSIIHSTQRQKSVELFLINSFFGLPDSLMLLMFSGDFGRAFLELCQQNTTTSWAILAVLLSHCTAYMNPGRGVGVFPTM